jgi:hypothetical protein
MAKLLTQNQASLLYPFLSLNYHGASCQSKGHEENNAMEQILLVLFVLFTVYLIIVSISEYIYIYIGSNARVIAE